MSFKIAHQSDDGFNITTTCSYDGGGVIESFTYCYDADGNPIDETDFDRNDEEPPDEPRIFPAK